MLCVAILIVYKYEYVSARALHTGIARFRLATSLTSASHKYSVVALGFDHSVKRVCGTPGNKDPGNTRAGTVWNCTGVTVG